MRRRRKRRHIKTIKIKRAGRMRHKEGRREGARNEKKWEVRGRRIE